jgi:transposase InsO family protein
VVWGLDLVRPLKRAPKGYTHLLITIDKVTKWIEAWPIVKIRSKEVMQFFMDIIPNSIITDNGKQFMGKKFLRFCNDNQIRVDWATVAHPHTNGQVERVNGMVL